MWVTEGGDLCTADWAAWPAGAPACVCRLHATAVRSTALVSDEKRIRGVRRARRCAIQIDNLYLFTFTKEAFLGTATVPCVALAYCYFISERLR